MKKEGALSKKHHRRGEAVKHVRHRPRHAQKLAAKQSQRKRKESEHPTKKNKATGRSSSSSHVLNHKRHGNNHPV